MTSSNLALKQELRPFQRQGVADAIGKFQGRCLLGDEMGLGKTPQAIAVAEYYNAWPIIVVCPASLRWNWRREFLSWSKHVSENEIAIIESKKSPIGGKVVIISYELAVKLDVELSSIRASMIILDESHKIKNPKAIRTKRLLAICKTTPRVLLLTGTAVLNRPIELWSQLMALRQAQFGTMWEFAKRYCNLHRGRFGWDMNGARNLEELNNRLRRDCLIRRLKKDVLQELPPKERRRIVVQSVNQKSDESIVAECSKALKRAKGVIEHARAIMRTKIELVTGMIFKEYSFLGSHKAPMALEWILENATLERPTVVFAHHIATIAHIAAGLSQAGKSFFIIDGKTPGIDRQRYVEEFQAGKYEAALLSINAASTGLTLTRAQDMLIVELPFSPGIAVQAEDRIYRIGQKSNVTINYLISENSMDEYVWRMINKKSAIQGAVLDGEAKSQLEGSAMEESESAGYWRVVDQILHDLSTKFIS